MDTKKIIIYIPLVNEGTIVFRPTLGEEINENIYRVLPTKDYNPNDENWEFKPGEIVLCIEEMRFGKKMLIAKERVS